MVLVDRATLVAPEDRVALEDRVAPAALEALEALEDRADLAARAIPVVPVAVVDGPAFYGARAS